MLLSLPQIPSFWRLGLMLGCDQGHVTLELTCSLTRYLVSHIQQPAGISMWIFNRHHTLTNFYPYPIHWSLPISLNGTSILRVVQDRNLEGLLAFHSFPHIPSTRKSGQASPSVSSIMRRPLPAWTRTGGQPP